MVSRLRLYRCLGAVSGLSAVVARTPGGREVASSSLVSLTILSRIMMRKYIPEWASRIPEEAKCVFSGEIYDVYQWPQEMYDGTTATFEMLRRADTVKIIAVLTPEEQARLNNVVKITTSTEDRIVITKQKQPRKDWFYDYPGGRVDTGDADELAGAKRELLEEAGLEFANWRLVDVKQPFNKIDWLVYTFVASGLVQQTEQNLDSGELIEVELATIPEIQELAKSKDSQYLRFKYFDKLSSVAELLELPELK